jgi:hypothetical protein
MSIGFERSNPVQLPTQQDNDSLLSHTIFTRVNIAEMYESVRSELRWRGKDFEAVETKLPWLDQLGKEGWELLKVQQLPQPPQQPGLVGGLNRTATYQLSLAQPRQPSIAAREVEYRAEFTIRDPLKQQDSLRGDMSRSVSSFETIPGRIPRLEELATSGWKLADSVPMPPIENANVFLNIYMRPKLSFEE